MEELPTDVREAIETQLTPGETAREGYVRSTDAGVIAHVVTGMRVIGAEAKQEGATESIDLSHYLLTDSRIFGVTYEDEASSMSIWVGIGVLTAVVGGILTIAGAVGSQAVGAGASQAFGPVIAGVGLAVLLFGVALAAITWGSAREISVRVHSTAQSKEWTLHPAGEPLAREISIVVGENQS